jgi:hypothetical protein
MCSRAVIIADGELRHDSSDLRDLENTFRRVTQTNV